MGKLLNIDDNKANHGLYGFNNGSQSFGFREDGTAFIGKSNSGRIDFDGTKGVITSSGMTLEGSGDNGIYMDLDAPKLLIKSNGTNLLRFDNNY
jgi:hypothetical protein